LHIFKLVQKSLKKSSKKGQKLQSRDKIPKRESTENQTWGNRNRQQWRTQKIFMGISFSGIWWQFVFGVRSLCSHNLTSYSRFHTNVLAKYIDIICIYFYTHSPYFMCQCTEYKLSAFQVRISVENKLNATTQQFIPTKISGSSLKQGCKHTHHCVRAIYNCKMRLR